MSDNHLLDVVNYIARELCHEYDLEGHKHPMSVLATSLWAANVPRLSL